MRALFIASLLVSLGFATHAFGQVQPPSLVDGKLQPTVQEICKTYCFACHGSAAGKVKGDFAIDKLSLDFRDSKSRTGWLAVLKRIQRGEMPPRGKPQPSGQEKQIIKDWIAAGVKHAEAQRTREGRVVLRRLNRVEYENTVRDLLGIHIELRDMLPEDGSASGFDNVAEALHTSTFLLEKYLEAAEKALDIAIANGPRPHLVKKRFFLKDERQVKRAEEKVFRQLDDGVVMFSSSPWQAVHLYDFYPPDRGRYRFRISASGFQSKGKPVTYRVDAGRMEMTGKTHLVGYFDAAANKPAIVEWVETLEPRSTIRILPYGLASAQAVHKIGADKYAGPGLAVQWVEVEGPLHDQWPPESHRRIFGNLPRESSPTYNFSNRVEVVSKNPEKDAEAILRTFARRAFRRTVQEGELQPFLKLVKGRLRKKYSFEKAMRVGLMAILLSPEFLFLREQPGKLDDFALASRLSYFLWSTMPDETLLTLAEQKKLSDPKVLHDQVERLLKDKKAQAFTENFVGQWLNLRDIDATVPSHILYPEYDEMLKESMLKETYLFWDEILKNDLSLTNLVHSDFSMLNGRLARHYGISAVAGWEFKKVMLPRDSHRGGVLTMASVLKVTANGTYTSPIPRGSFVLDRILGTPPPRPPEGISALEPDIRGTTTIRQQLAKHRQVQSCASCHAKIDPPGFALESFDVIGGWRNYYRTSGRGKVVLKEGRRVPYLQGPNVDAGDVMASGKKFRDIDEFKKILLESSIDQVAFNLTARLVTYATGAAPRLTDQEEMQAIIERTREKHYGLRSLVHEIVQSRLFLHK